jgi:hypothetical protein
MRQTNAYGMQHFSRRYPVHGGGWQANTPPTPGDFNLPAPEMLTVTPAEATGKTMPLASPQATDVPVNAAPQDEGALPRWTAVVLMIAAGLVVWFMLAGRFTPPPLQ